MLDVDAIGDEVVDGEKDVSAPVAADDKVVVAAVLLMSGEQEVPKIAEGAEVLMFRRALSESVISAGSACLLQEEEEESSEVEVALLIVAD